MAEWLDDFVAQTQETFGTERAHEQNKADAEAQRQKLGNLFFNQLYTWVAKTVPAFNEKFKAKVLNLSPPGQNFISWKATPTKEQERTIQLRYDPVKVLFTWMASSKGQAAASGIEIQLVSVDSEQIRASYQDGSENRTFGVEEFGQFIMAKSLEKI